MRKSRLQGHTDHANTIYSIRTHQNMPFFMKTGQKWPFFVKCDFLALYKQLKEPPPYFEGAGCKKASCGHTKITTTDFVASVCTTFCHFSWKKRLKMAISWSKNDFFWPQTSG